MTTRWCYSLSDTPGNHDNAQPERWARPLHHDVARDFGPHVPWEEHCESYLKWPLIEPKRSGQGRNNTVHCSRGPACLNPFLGQRDAHFRYWYDRGKIDCDLYEK